MDIKTFELEIVKKLGQFAESCTLQTGVDGLRNLIKYETTDNDRMMLLLNKLAHFSDNLKVSQMKE